MKEVDYPKKNLRTARMTNYHKKDTHGLCYCNIIIMYILTHIIFYCPNLLYNYK